MDFSLDDEFVLIQQTAREFSERELAPAAERIDREERFPLAHFEKLAALGFLGFLVPEEYGGAGLGSVALYIALEEISRACASTCVSLSVHNSLVCGPLAKFGDAEQKKRYLPRLVRGDLIGAYALTEPEHGSDAAALETRARRVGDHYVLSGRKAWITNAPFAGLVLTFATVDPALGRDGITAFLVEPNLPGFVVGRREKKMGIRGSETAEIGFEDVEVPVENRLGDEGEGFAIAMDTLNGGRIGIAAQAVGISQACLQSSRSFARERKQFGKSISKFQPIQWKLTEMALGIDSSRLLALRAAWLRDSGRPHAREAAMAKLLASRVANQSATDAVQIHGGAGYCKDYPVERFFRDAKITEIYEGTTEIQHIVIAKELLREAISVGS